MLAGALDWRRSESHRAVTKLNDALCPSTLWRAFPQEVPSLAHEPPQEKR